MEKSGIYKNEIRRLDNEINEVTAKIYETISVLVGTTSSIDSTFDVSNISGSLVSADDYLNEIYPSGIIETDSGTYNIKTHELTYKDEYGKDRTCKMSYYLPEGVTDLSTLNVFTLLGTKSDIPTENINPLYSSAPGYSNIKETQCLLCVLEKATDEKGKQNTLSGAPARYSSEINAGTRFANAFAKSNPETKNIIAGGSIGGMSAVKIAAESVQNGECLYDVIVSANYPGVRTDGKCPKTSYYDEKGKLIRADVSGNADAIAYLTQEDVDRLISTDTKIVCISSESCGNVTEFLKSKSIPAYNGFAKMVENAESRGIEYKCSVRFIGTESTVNNVQSNVSADAKELIKFDSNYETYGINDKSLIKGGHNYYTYIEADIISNTEKFLNELV